MKRRNFLLTATAASFGGFSKAAGGTDRPNILWLTCEDNNIDWVGCYGNPHAKTPNIDRLATEGFQYMHCFANAPVCAPSRSTWITGIMALSMGTHPMRSRYEIPHDRIKYYPDYLKANGYYVGNDKKTDYNIGGRKDPDCWDKCGKVDWNSLRNNQPFFQIINSTTSHESKAQGDVENTLHDPDDTRLRKYHPDVQDVRKNYAKYHDAMKRMDAEIGDSLRRLEREGLAENTIVIHNSDHGGVLPRSKRYLFESGIHCPLILRIPERYKALWPAERPGMKVDRLVSFVDMPKTWLDITGSKVPNIMQGRVFLGPRAEPEREFHFAFRGRMDERIENARALCDKRFLYIRNYMPYVPWMQHLDYLWKMTATQAWERQVQAGKANEVQARFFAPKEWTEELYDMQNDPDGVDNLIENPEFRQIADRMQKSLRQKQLAIYDSGLIPESDLIRLAGQNDLTIFDVVRDPKLYDLPALIDAADIALDGGMAAQSKLVEMIASPNAGIRYWAAVGCFLASCKPEGFETLFSDASHEVRIMAAWLAIKTGEKEKGIECLKQLLATNSYASLTALNLLDWLGDEGQRLMSLVKQLKCGEKSYEARMKQYLLEKWSV